MHLKRDCRWRIEVSFHHGPARFEDGSTRFPVNHPLSQSSLPLWFPFPFKEYSNTFPNIWPSTTHIRINFPEFPPTTFWTLRSKSSFLSSSSWVVNSDLDLVCSSWALTFGAILKYSFERRKRRVEEVSRSDEDFFLSPLQQQRHPQRVESSAFLRFEVLAIWLSKLRD